MTSRPSRALVLRKLRQAFPDESLAQQALALLDTYGLEPHELERERVQLAILKLSGGDLDQLRQAVAQARVDYRDILAWAEYPEEMSAGAPGPDTPPEILRARGERDREQYEQWLNS